MLDAKGTVIAQDGRFAVVRMDATGCGRCHEEGGCGGNNLGKKFCSSPRTFRVLNPENVVIGSHVSVVITEGVVRRSALQAYGVPLLALFIGAVFGFLLFGDIGAVIGSICGLICSWVALCFNFRHGKSDLLSQPFIKS